MKFNSQICTTKEQSERLLTLGLRKETADMVILEHPRKEGRYFYIAKEDANFDGFPAWSLHRLIEIYGVRNIMFNLDLYNSIYDRIIHRIKISINSGTLDKEYLESLCGKH